MSKFTGRMNRLFLKTHIFISHGNHCLVRDYFKAKLEESEKPEDFEERYKKFLELKERYLETSKEEDWEKYDEFVKDNLPVWFNFRHLLSVEYCEKHPRGNLVKKEFGDNFMKFVSDARRYFKTKTEKTSQKR